MRELQIITNMERQLQFYWEYLRQLQFYWRDMLLFCLILPCLRERDFQGSPNDMWLCFWPMMPRYGMDTAGTCHRYGRDMNVTHKKWSIGHDIAYFEVFVHHSFWRFFLGVWDIEKGLHPWPQHCNTLVPTNMINHICSRLKSITLTCTLWSHHSNNVSLLSVKFHFNLGNLCRQTHLRA